MIYLASSYSHPNEQVRVMRYGQALGVVAHLFAIDAPVFSPIVYTHNIALCAGLTVGFSRWAPFDLDMLDGCSDLWVLMLDGWQYSEGIQVELRHAARNGVKLEFFTCDEIFAAESLADLIEVDDE